MNSGTNYLTALVTDISGNAITGLTIASFDISGQVGTTGIYGATAVTSANVPGYYTIQLDIPLGQGFVQVKPTDPNYFVTPTFYDIDTTIYSEDDIYASIIRQSLDTTQTAVTSYESQNIGPFKAGDDIEFTYVVPDAVAVSISGYTNFKASLFSDAILTSVTGSGYIGDFAVTADTSSKIVTMSFPASSSTLLVDEGNVEQYYYSDLQATTNTGKNKTLAELSILLRRNFTRP